MFENFQKSYEMREGVKRYPCLSVTDRFEGDEFKDRKRQVFIFPKWLYEFWIQVKTIASSVMETIEKGMVTSLGLL